MQRSNIPIYAHLYGESESPRLPDALHSERLEQRSGFHDWKIKPHRHDQLVQIFALLEGGGEAEIDGRTISFVAPFIIYVPSLTVHSFQYFPDSTGYVLSAFKDEAAACLADEPNLLPLFNRAITISYTDNQSYVDNALKKIINFHNEYRASNPGRLLVLRSLLSIIMVGLSRCVSDENDDISEMKHSDQKSVSTLMEIIEQHYTDNHGTEFYARAMNMTPSKLRQITQSILGVSAHQLINNKILLEAKRNMLYTSMTASQIADMLGFKDPAYFSRFFKKHTGESPSDYRKRA